MHKLDEEVVRTLKDKPHLDDTIYENVPNSKQNTDTTRDMMISLRSTSNDPEAGEINWKILERLFLILLIHTVTIVPQESC
ncbi:unnamed protein product [Ambrosiozyma monospora]|uniref:Unnamed protein product n=1 Tax=Ambrosiozyma monospora TaxID=43982 RepID=A0ACB5T1E8_AMBMO|nr:unnamed protein product [Ambrosiozyma monospora]